MHRSSTLSCSKFLIKIPFLLIIPLELLSSLLSMFPFKSFSSIPLKSRTQQPNCFFLFLDHKFKALYSCSIPWSFPFLSSDQLCSSWFLIQNTSPLLLHDYTSCRGIYPDLRQQMLQELFSAGLLKIKFRGMTIQHKCFMAFQYCSLYSLLRHQTFK